MPSSGEGPPHPLYASQANDNPLLSAAVSGGTFDERGNYFNEELLRVRGQAGAVSSSGSTAPEDGSRGQGSRKGDALMDSAGNFFSSARLVLFISRSLGVVKFGVSFFCYLTKVCRICCVWPMVVLGEECVNRLLCLPARNEDNHTPNSHSPSIPVLGCSHET